jgi:O6-methylguanine-DNA--protein-cysteine methyltransferase
MLGNLPSQVDQPATSDSPALPDSLSEAQLATLSEITKEGLQTRLKLLKSTQDTLQACMKQMQQALSAISPGDVQAVASVAAELGEHSAADTSQSPDTKGKGKEP